MFTTKEIKEIRKEIIDHLSELNNRQINLNSIVDCDNVDEIINHNAGDGEFEL
jgi:hypothetical protein